jgi:hypothetical protein
MPDTDPEAALAAARRMGVEADADEARQWMLAVAAGEHDERIAADDQAGIFGDRVSLLDFDPDDLGRFRGLMPHVRLEPRPELESAISIAGSAAQGKIQLFPGDADFFERAHIHAETEDEAKQTLRALMRETALRAVAEPDIVLLEVDLGQYPEPVIQRGTPVKAGHTIEWTTPDVVQGYIEVETPGGASKRFAWDDQDPCTGWLYLYWIVAERDAGRIAIASNVVDPTWEDLSGTVRSLDGAVDPLVQEIYLEASALPLVERLHQLVARGAREAYQEAMREQVYHYAHVQPSYGKVAKRLYNLFRVSDELEAAAYVRELFDEPSARLYQITGLLEAADAALDDQSGIDRESVLRQLDVVADAIADVTEGAEESSLLGEIAKLREAALREGRASGDWGPVLADVRERCAEIVNEFFRTRLLAYDRISEILASLPPSPEH